MVVCRAGLVAPIGGGGGGGDNGLLVILCLYVVILWVVVHVFSILFVFFVVGLLESKVVTQKQSLFMEWLIQLFSIIFFNYLI